jgi:hypothetical protein
VLGSLVLLEAVRCFGRVAEGVSDSSTWCALNEGIARVRLRRGGSFLLEFEGPALEYRAAAK